MQSYPSGFYVYMLVDPRTGIPFYVGKGQRSRAWQHASAVVRGDLTGNTRKVAKIQEILKCGHQVEIQIVAEYDLENDALEHEFELVDSMVELTNIIPGGGGGPGGRRLTSEEIAERERLRHARIIDRQKEGFVRSAEHREIQRRKWFLSKPSFQGHKSEIEAWLERTKPAPIDIRNLKVSKRKYGLGFHVQAIKSSRPPKLRSLALEAAEQEERTRPLDEKVRQERNFRLYPHDDTEK